MPDRPSKSAASAMTLVLYLFTGCDPPEEYDGEEDAFASESTAEADDSASTDDEPEEAALPVHDDAEAAAGRAVPDYPEPIADDITAALRGAGGDGGKPRPCRPTDIITRLIADGVDGPTGPRPNCNGG